MTKTGSSRRYRNNYTIGWINKVCYFSDRRHLFLTSLTSGALIEINVTDSNYLLAGGR